MDTQSSSASLVRSGDAPYSVAVLTHNEEAALPGLLDSLPIDVAVLVVDSGSADQTVAIAERYGCLVRHRAFTGFGDQRNFAMDAAGEHASWQLHLDADERMTPALDAAVRNVATASGGADAYAIPNKCILNGRWIRRSSGYPVYQVRLVRRAKVRFINHGHGQQEAANTSVGRLEEPYIHHAYIHGITHWLAKHVHYAAREVLLEANGGPQVRILDFMSRDSLVRRRAVRDFSRWLPCKGILRVVWILIVKRGFLDGRQGLTYARMLSVYEGMKDIQRDELRFARDLKDS